MNFFEMLLAQKVGPDRPAAPAEITINNAAGSSSNVVVKIISLDNDEYAVASQYQIAPGGTKTESNALIPQKIVISSSGWTVATTGDIEWNSGDSTLIITGEGTATFTSV